MMRTLFLMALLALAGASPAAAQSFNTGPRSVPLAPGSAPPLTAPAPPATAPGPMQPPLGAPGAPPSLDTWGDRAARCVHYGTAMGVPPGQIGAYTSECAN
jgi:hypothetical protein